MVKFEIDSDLANTKNKKSPFFDFICLRNWFKTSAAKGRYNQPCESCRDVASKEKNSWRAGVGKVVNESKLYQRQGNSTAAMITMLLNMAYPRRMDARTLLWFMNGLIMLDCFLRQNAGLYTIWVVPSLNKLGIAALANLQYPQSEYPVRSPQFLSHLDQDQHCLASMLPKFYLSLNLFSLLYIIADEILLLTRSCLIGIHGWQTS